MSKLGCICGHTIFDKTSNLSYKAKFIRVQDAEKTWAYSDDIASFIEAIQLGKRDQWIAEYFSSDYPTQIDNSSIIFDIVSSHEKDVSGDIYQCENCGRIMIQVRDTNVFASFKPEDDRYKNIFTSSAKENGT